MPDIYVIIVVILFALAISDLIVGVSNDAVNFLNSSIGSKVAPRWTILLIASAGIFVGATFSSGMMEVARKGIFHPEYFYFEEIMILFIAVMLTDIILLDLFNTFGMPTSTTVSIVFELLGAAVAISLLKISQAGEGLSELSKYINSSQALAIISGILLSVGVAFTLGVIIQFFSRLFFSFHYKRRIKLVGVIWSGISLTALMYFLLVKGAKGASFISDDMAHSIKENALVIMGISFLFWTVLMRLLLFFKVDILKITVLFGTFSLAMAFAGNDLVNFIGVPIAGFESFNAWKETGLDPGTYDMAILKEPVRSNTLLLLLAGLIMIVTLWFSKKARSVTDTEVNLGRQEEGFERFNPNLLSRALVRMGNDFGKGITYFIPKSFIDKANESFQRVNIQSIVGAKDSPPAFDLVRASVNLTVASVIISFATSLKLPLSTTYVTFMVAMGTSLADQAWGRDSAVYRVAGVLNVIGGWFMTAIIAFSVSALFAWMIFQFGHWVIGLLVLLAIALLVRSYTYHRKSAKLKEQKAALEIETQDIIYKEVFDKSSDKVASIIDSVQDVLSKIISELILEDRSNLKKSKKKVKELRKANEEFKLSLFNLLKRIKTTSADGSRIYLYVYDLEQDLLQSVKYILDTSIEYVENVHKPLHQDQIVIINQIQEELKSYLFSIRDVLHEKDFTNAQLIMDHKKQLLTAIEDALIEQVNNIRERKFGPKNSMLYFSILLELKDVIAVAARFVKLYHRIEKPEREVILQ